MGEDQNFCNDIVENNKKFIEFQLRKYFKIINNPKQKADYIFFENYDFLLEIELLVRQIKMIIFLSKEDLGKDIYT